MELAIVLIDENPIKANPMFENMSTVKAEPHTQRA